MALYSINCVEYCHQERPELLASAKSCAVVGLDGIVVDVEVDISPGLPRFDVVGLPDTAVQEARARVRAAIRNSGCEFPLRRITANLAPADVRKAGSSYDLPLAIALLQSSGQLEPVGNDTMFVGQLSLNGDLLHTDGVLPMVALAKESGARPRCSSPCRTEKRRHWSRV